MQVKTERKWAQLCRRCCGLYPTSWAVSAWVVNRGVTGCVMNKAQAHSSMSRRLGQLAEWRDPNRPGENDMRQRVWTADIEVADDRRALTLMR